MSGSHSHLEVQARSALPFSLSLSPPFIIYKSLLPGGRGRGSKCVRMATRKLMPFASSKETLSSGALFDQNAREKIQILKKQELHMHQGAVKHVHGRNFQIGFISTKIKLSLNLGQSITSQVQKIRPDSTWRWSGISNPINEKYGSPPLLPHTCGRMFKSIVAMLQITSSMCAVFCFLSSMLVMLAVFPSGFAKMTAGLYYFLKSNIHSSIEVFCK